MPTAAETLKRSARVPARSTATAPSLRTLKLREIEARIAALEAASAADKAKHATRIAEVRRAQADTRAKLTARAAR